MIVAGDLDGLYLQQQRRDHLVYQLKLRFCQRDPLSRLPQRLFVLLLRCFGIVEPSIQKASPFTGAPVADVGRPFCLTAFLLFKSLTFLMTPIATGSAFGVLDNGAVFMTVIRKHTLCTMDAVVSHRWMTDTITSDLAAYGGSVLLQTSGDLSKFSSIGQTSLDLEPVFKSQMFIHRVHLAFLKTEQRWLLL